MHACGPLPLPIPDPEVEVRSERLLRATLRRIDGWGPIAWREILGTWRLGSATVVLEAPEWEAGDDDDERMLFLVLDHGLGQGDPAATADWVLRHAWATLLAKPVIHAWTVRPGAAVRATNACWSPAPGRIVLRLHFDLPYAGMCNDAKRLGRFLTQVAAFAEDLATRRRRPALLAHRRAVAVQQALRAALPAAGLCAFLAEGSVLPRASDGGPAVGATPLMVPKDLAVTLDLGSLGRHRGLGLRTGVTALAGAPYHGKSTLLGAIAAGAEDHPPGDGREGVVADASLIPVQAEDGRRIAATDLSTFFAALPGADPRCFTTARASGATSMAATVLQGIAGGCRLLLIDEDTAASNLLVIDAGMRRFLGAGLDGTRTLLEHLPAFAAAGISTVLVAGSSTASLAAADRVLIVDHFQPRDATRAARRIAGPRPPTPPFTARGRHLGGNPDAMFGPRHFLRIDATEPERPRLKVADRWQVLDLRRSGWSLDGPRVSGAILAAAWCCRLAAGGCPVAELADRYAAWIAQGPAALDPFHTALVTVPPWPLVLAVLERLDGVALSGAPTSAG